MHLRILKTRLTHRIRLQACMEVVILASFGIGLCGMPARSVHGFQDGAFAHFPTRTLTRPDDQRRIVRQLPDREMRTATLRSNDATASQQAHKSQFSAGSDLDVLFAKDLPKPRASGVAGRSEIRNATSKDGVLVPASGMSETALTLPKRGKNRKSASSNAAEKLGAGSLEKMGISLGIVLAAFFGLTWLLKRGGAKTNNGAIPNQVVQILGRAPLNGKQMMQLVRLGDKVLLLAISPTGTESLGEIVDRDEVDAVTEICLAKNPARIRATFRETLDRIRQGRHSDDHRAVGY